MSDQSLSFSFNEADKEKYSTIIDKFVKKLGGKLSGETSHGIYIRWYHIPRILTPDDIAEIKRFNATYTALKIEY